MYVCIYRMIHNLVVLHRKVYKKDKTVIGLEFMEQIYKDFYIFVDSYHS